MATAEDIGANFSNYVGNAALGGGGATVVNIDTKPIEDLARYTMIKNSVEFNQRQKDAEMWAKEMADNTSYDLALGIPKYSKIVQEGYKEFIDYVKANPTAKNYQQNPQKYLEYKQKKAEFEQTLKAGKTQDILGKVWDTRIENETNVAEKARLKKIKDSEIEAKDINTPISAEQKINLKFTKTPAPTYHDLDIGQVDANGVWIRKNKLLNMGDVKAKSILLGLQLEAESLDINSYEFKKTLEGKTDFEKEQLTQEAQARSNQKDGFSVMRDDVNAVLQDPKFQTDGKLDIKKVRDSKALGRIAGLIEQINADRARMVQEIEGGIYSDKIGRPINFDGKVLNKENYKPINLEDGLDGSEFIEIQMQAQAVEDGNRETKYQQTNEGINKAKLALDRDELEFKKKEAQKTGAASTFIEAPARLLRDHIMRVADYYKRNPKESMVVKFGGVDAETRVATGVKENQEVEFQKDGSWRVIATKDHNLTDDKGKEITDASGNAIEIKAGKVLKTGTIDGLKKGFTDAVKIGQGTDGSQTEGFQLKTEAGFNQILGTNDANAIFNSIMGGQNTNTPSSGKVDANGFPIN